MKKFIKEIFTYFGIPLIIALVSYMFFQLHDILLGVVTLVVLSAVYATIQLYFTHRKWWLGLILVGLALGYLAFFLLRAPTITLSINGQEVRSSPVTLSSGSVLVSPSPQSNGEYSKNTMITLTATPADGYDWKGWTGTDNDAVNPTTVTMNKDKHVTAVFERRYSLIINNQLVIGSLVSFNEGSILVSPAPDGDGKYTSGTVVTLNAVPSSGYDLKSWSGTDDNYSDPTTVTINSDKTLSVNFFQRFSLTIGNQLVIGTSVILDTGAVLIDPPPGGDSKYTSGTVVTLTALPNAGYDWKSWSGTANDNAKTTKVIIASDKYVSVTFNPRYALTVNGQVVTGASVGVTGGSVSVNPAAGTDQLFTKDIVVTFTALPASGYRFDHWSGDASGILTSATVTMGSNKNVTAVFVKTWNLTASTSPAAGGSVSPAGGSYDDGTSVTMTAAPAPGYRFDHWSGDAAGSLPTINVTMNSAKNISANFVKIWTLATSAVPAAGGTVSPAGGTYDDGTVVSLAATSASGYRFDHWSGDATGTAATVSVTMSAARNVTATFVKIWTLSTAIDPSAGGTISPAPGTFDDGTIVSLKAVPATGYRFDHWSGDALGTNATVSVTMTGNKSATATFIKVYTLSVVVNPAAGGTIAPTGTTYDSGVVVTLTATASAGYRFDHWSGDVSGTLPSVDVTMSANRSVTATFVKVWTLTTSVLPASSGSVSPASGTFDDGTVVTLMTAQVTGYRFDHWSGDVPANFNLPNIDVTMNSDKNITANFVVTVSAPVGSSVNIKMNVAGMAQNLNPLARSATSSIYIKTWIANLLAFAYVHWKRTD
jgi:uncharacterized repeat protein (TIGR02543 family)